MGLCASQARLLMLTGRKSDLEFRRMQISNAKQVLAMETEDIAMARSESLANMCFTNINDDENTPLNAQGIFELLNSDQKQLYWYVDYERLMQFAPELGIYEGSYEGDKAYLVDGKVKAFADENKNKEYIEHGRNGYTQAILNKLSPEDLQKAISEGIIQLRSDLTDENSIVDIAGSQIVKERRYTDDDDIAQAEYDAAMAQIKRKEQTLDIESQQIETQYTAVTTEIDAVQGLVKKNSEQGMKYFS